MANNIAVVIIHGAGIHRRSQNGIDIMQAMQSKLETRFKEQTNETPLKFAIIYWDEHALLQDRQDEFRKTLEANGIRFQGLPDINGFVRQNVFDILGDVAAYQPVNDKKMQPESTYSIVHHTLATSLAELSVVAGEDAPLCIIGHSLGSVIASNYIYDLRRHTPKKKLIPESVKAVIGQTPLEQGKTLRCLFTMGSPMALWRLRTGKLDKPIKVPLWINFFDNSDPIAYPLQELLFQDHGEIVVQDVQVETGMTPKAHTGYWENKKVIDVIVRHLVDVWKLTKDTA